MTTFFAWHKKHKKKKSQDLKLETKIPGTDKYPENFTFLILKILELFTRNVCEMFVCKHTKII